MNGRLERLSPTARVIAWRLTEGRCVSYDEYLDALWRNCPDGGPLWAKGIINIKLVELRRDLTACGVTLVRLREVGCFVPQEDISRLRQLLAWEIADYADPRSREINRRLARVSRRHPVVMAASHEATVEA